MATNQVAAIRTEATSFTSRSENITQTVPESLSQEDISAVSSAKKKRKI
jgi:hypothetical protein